MPLITSWAGQGSIRATIWVLILLLWYSEFYADADVCPLADLVTVLRPPAVDCARASARQEVRWAATARPAIDMAVDLEARLSRWPH